MLRRGANKRARVVVDAGICTQGLVKIPLMIGQLHYEKYYLQAHIALCARGLDSGAVEHENVHVLPVLHHGGMRKFDSRITRSVNDQHSEEYILSSVGVHVVHDIEPSPTKFLSVKFEHPPAHQCEASIFRRFAESPGNRSSVDTSSLATTLVWSGDMYYIMRLTEKDMLFKAIASSDASPTF